MATNSKENYKQEGAIQYVGVASDAEYSIGELACFNATTHKAEAFDAIADNATYIGVFGSEKTSSDTSVSEAKVYKKGVFEFDVEAGTYYINDEFRWSAAPRTVALSTSNQIGRCFQETLAAATTVLLKIDAYVAY